MDNWKTLLLMGVGGAALFTAVRAQAIPLGVGSFSKADAYQLVREYNASQGGWFDKDGRSLVDIMAIFATESGFNPKAYNPNDVSGAWGMGQMLATTARDFGVQNPQELFNPKIAVRTTMDYLKWSYIYLSANLNRAPTRDEWIGSYNSGVGGILKGRIPTFYLLKWQAARALI